MRLMTSYLHDNDGDLIKMWRNVILLLEISTSKVQQLWKMLWKPDALHPHEVPIFASGTHDET